MLGGTLSELANILSRAGVLTSDQVQAVHQASQTQGVPSVEALLDLGFVAEDELVGFLHSKLMIPRADPDILAGVASAPASRIPANLAWSHHVLPVSQDHTGNLTVAMADPTDQGAVDAVAAHTGAYLVRAVAPARALRDALARHYGPRPAASPADSRPAMATDRTKTWPPSSNERRWTPPPPPPHGDLAGTQRWTPVPGAQADEQPPPATEHAPVPSSSAPPTAAASGPAPQPTLEAPPEPHAGAPVVPLSPEAFTAVLPRMVAAVDRDDILHVLMDFLASGFPRVILFVHAKEQLRGREARGEDLDTAAVQQVRIPANLPSVFQSVLETRTPRFGPIRGDTPVDQAFAGALGGIDGNALVLPVVLRDKVPLLVFASGARHPIDPRSLTQLAEAVSQGLERIIMGRKASSGPTTAAAGG